MRRQLPLLVLALIVLGACGDGETFDPPTTSTIGSTTTTAPPATSTTVPPASTTTSEATTTTTAPSPDVVISGGEGSELSIEGPDRVSVSLGDDVELSVLSSVGGELHLHGYDLFYELIADEPMVVTFTADIPGIFELEIEASHTLVVEFEIVP